MTGSVGNTGFKNLTYGEFVEVGPFFDDGLNELAMGMVDIIGEENNVYPGGSGHIDKDMSINPYRFVNIGKSALGMDDIVHPNNMQMEKLELIKVLAYCVAKPEYAGAVSDYLGSTDA